MIKSGFVAKAALVVGGGGLIFGYDIGVISTTINAMKRDIEMNPLQEGVVIGIMGAGACFGALVAGPLLRLYGAVEDDTVTESSFLCGIHSDGCFVESYELVYWTLHYRCCLSCELHC